ncbi:hypothetical protein WICPIJ_005002 [Wickerhamomyces pijperi]|uniref:Uncharacterized protein n=1 Tax=Wickerhamomyces pijperi TaxID=599730 RepID=A0A9P8Q6I9_WICPI|nr:hypothetical protein WICPIJ_005002 [Wickerhamomyces pijperi]
MKTRSKLSGDNDILVFRVENLDQLDDRIESASYILWVAVILSYQVLEGPSISQDTRAGTKGEWALDSQHEVIVTKRGLEQQIDCGTVQTFSLD